MKQVVTKGATSQIQYVFIRDSSATTGVGLTGLAYNTASLVASYVRPGAARTAITLVTQTVTGAYASGGFVEVDATNMPGVYRVDVPDAVFATGVNSAVVMLKGAANMEPVVLEVQLLGVDLQDATRGGMTALPNAAAEAAGGLYTRGTGAGQINQPANGSIDTNTKTWNALTTVALPLVPTTAGRTLDVSTGGEAGVDWANVGSPTTTVALTGTTVAPTQKVDVDTIKTQALTAAAGITFPTSIASPTNITGGTITTVTNLTNAPTVGDLTATMKTSIGTAVAASAVASVTGNVGGSVASVVGLTAANLDAAISTRASTTSLATVAGYIDTEVASILAVTAKLDTAMELDGSVYRFTTNSLEQAPSGGGSGGLDAAATRAALGLATANLDVQLAALQADTDNIQTRIPAALVSGRMDSYTGAMANNVVTAAAAASDLTTELQTGLATAAALTTVGGNVTTLLTDVAAVPAAVWATAVDGSVTAAQSLRLANSANAGKVAGMATDTVTVRDLADTKARITASVDASGNRTAVTRDLS